MIMGEKEGGSDYKTFATEKLTKKNSNKQGVFRCLLERTQISDFIWE